MSISKAYISVSSIIDLRCIGACSSIASDLHVFLKDHQSSRLSAFDGAASPSRLHFLFHKRPQYPQQLFFSSPSTRPVACLTVTLPLLGSDAQHALLSLARREVPESE